MSAHHPQSFRMAARFLRPFAVFAVLAGTLLVPAAASAAPPTLTGLIGYGFNHLDTEGTVCGQEGSTIPFRTSGPSVGTYPGEFEATGTIQSGPATITDDPNGTGFIYYGPVTGFTETFKIVSGETVIEGTKSYPPELASSNAACGNWTGIIPENPNPYPDRVRDSFITGATYQATITSSEGVFTDEGTTYLEFSDNRAFGEPEPKVPLEGLSTAVFHEYFVSTLSETEPVIRDSDHDGVVDEADNCPNNANPDQADLDQDGVGDACDPDLDGDGVPNGGDNCATSSNPGQHDTDGDGIGDECDPFPGSTAGCKVTGGGQIAAPNGDRATFSIAAQAKSATEVKGEQSYQDHAIIQLVKFKSTTTGSVICEGSGATIRGTGTSGGAAVSYRIDVVDNGEPGSSDTYRIRLSNGYDSGTRPVEDGNIQAH